MKFIRKKGHRTLHVWSEALVERMKEKGDLEVVEIPKEKPVKGPTAADLMERQVDGEVHWNLEGMKRQELIKLASEKGIEDPFKMRNIDLIGALRTIK